MKKIFLVMAALMGFATFADAQSSSDVAVSGVRMMKDGSNMNVVMNIDLSKIDVKNNASLHIYPVIKNGADSVELAPIGVYGRGRYINYLRRGESVFQDMGETVYKEGKQPSVFEYAATVPYKAWMDGSKIIMNKKTCGCCQDLLAEDATPVGGYDIPDFVPHFIYIQPAPELVKQRELSGSAFIDYIVSRTDVNPEYRNNTVELAKIIATIDSVKNDSDIKVKSVFLKGFASPESPYDNNTRLARERTASLKQYVLNLYNIDEQLITTDFEPENWEGLRAYVANSNLKNKEAILKSIDSSVEPDRKEWIIKSTWPEDYAFLLANCYPALRKTDYKIEYTINSFTDINKILEVYRTAPGKLSLNEFYIAANAFEPGSKEYKEVFETAVAKYPEDPIANLNAANVAMSKGDYVTAKRHLNLSGNTKEAVYAKGLYHTAVHEFDQAEAYLKEAQQQGIAEAAQMLEQCAALKEFYSQNK